MIVHIEHEHALLYNTSILISCALLKPLLTGDCNTSKDQNYFEELHYISSYNVLPVLVFMVYSIELVDGCYAWIVVLFCEIENAV